ncbi:MAG: hypothetical protein ACE3JQ_05155 [Paenisporosarcina sp.]
MVITALVLFHIAIGMLVIPKNDGLPKLIHVVAITFFIMVMVYATFSFLPVLGQYVHVVKKYIFLDVIHF